MLQAQAKQAADVRAKAYAKRVAAVTPHLQGWVRLCVGAHMAASNSCSIFDLSTCRAECVAASLS
jgi:hypothetical protein